MIKPKIKSKKNGKTQKILSSLNKLSKANLQIGHFEESGLHGDSNLTNPELLKLWMLGVVQKDVVIVKNPLYQFVFDSIKSGKAFKTPAAKKAYKKFSSGLDKKQSSVVFLEEMGIALRDDYYKVFGRLGSFMPAVDSNVTPMLETGELRSKTAYKSSFDNQVKERGV